MVEESHVRKIKKDAYYVASSDGLGLIITIVQLKQNDKDNNYAEWAKAMSWPYPMPKLRTTLTQICKEEQHRNLARMDDHGSAGAAFTAVKPAPSPSTNSRQICSHCRHHGHASSSCFYLVGFLDCLVVAPEQETAAATELNLLEEREDAVGTEVGLLMAEHLSEVSRDRECRRQPENMKKIAGSMLCRSGRKERL
ncbi:hypothetical protein M9H77_23788 [Catharanthus roseus]|uniref:Uncharacterized protein n=1 Tax=Catharanthus roseus TaxID=4058 RepID=A0ACC0AUB0_CATRO|nr:hypothetical protein M9H77_23788 [Catharanthus roseus]